MKTEDNPETIPILSDAELCELDDLRQAYLDDPEFGPSDLYYLYFLLRKEKEHN